MRALTFDFAIHRLATARALGALRASGFLSPLGPVRLSNVPDARLLGDRWVVVETALAGICGSDVKQVFLDAAIDNPLRALVSFPHVLGHEHVGTVVEVGSAVTQVHAGDRVACSPWLSCVPRGLPECQACRLGDVSLCESFTTGPFSAGMHSGTCRDVSGGFAAYVPAHETSCHVLPDTTTFDDAVLADPFAVALHAILKSPPPPGEPVVVVGCGGLGALVVHALARLFPETEVFAVDPRPSARALATSLGAFRTFAGRGGALVAEVADALGVPLRRSPFAMPWIHHGVARVYDTVGAPITLEAGLRIVRPRGTLVLVGVSTPGRFEWTPLYFKEAAIVGSTGYGVETYLGRSDHAIRHYLDLLATARVRPEGVLTHRLPLDRYRDAFLAARSAGPAAAVKVAFDFRQSARGIG